MLTRPQKGKLFNLAVFSQLTGSKIDDEDLVEDADISESDIEEARRFIARHHEKVEAVANSASESWFEAGETLE